MSSTRERLKALEKELESLKPSVDRYYAINDLISDLKETVAMSERQAFKEKTMKDTSYVPCQLPKFGVEAKEVSAVFASVNQLDSLMRVISYGRDDRYEIEWSGSGKYRIAMIGWDLLEYPTEPNISYRILVTKAV